MKNFHDQQCNTRKKVLKNNNKLKGCALSNIVWP